MPSIKTVTTAYSWSGLPVVFGGVFIAQFSVVAAGLVLIAYALAGTSLLKCPRCGLATSSRIRKDRAGRERRSRLLHTPNPDFCSRCGLDFHRHTLGERFDLRQNAPPARMGDWEVIMPDDTIKVRATIRLLSRAENGRTKPIRGHYRPNHGFFGSESNVTSIGAISLPEGLELHPGQSIETSIDFWPQAGLAEQIYPGRQWRIQEGRKLVGIGTVIEVLPPNETPSSA